MRLQATLAIISIYLLQHVSAVDKSCWTSGNWISPRSNSDQCPDGLHAWKSDGMTICAASWRDTVGDEQQKDCMPNPDDCRALGDAIAKETHKNEHLIVKWETGSGKSVPMAIWSANDDVNCYKIHTAYGTCRFNFYVDEVPAENGRKDWRTIRGDLAKAVKGSAAFFPGADTNAPNNELEMRLFDGTFLSDDGKTYSSTGLNNELKGRLWFDPANPSCKEKCGKIDGYCY